MAILEGFLSNNFETGEFIGVEPESIPTNKLVIGSDLAPTFFTLHAVPVCFLSGVLQTTYDAVQPDYDKYCGLADKPDVAGGHEVAEGIHLYALLKEKRCGVRRETLVM